VHQFTSNARTIYGYTVKTIKTIKNDISTCFGFSQTILREYPELLKPTA
jgi:hypothetical protein